MTSLARLSALLATASLGVACSLSWSDAPPAGTGGSSSSSSGSSSASSSSSGASSSSSGMGGMCPGCTSSSSTSSSGVFPAACSENELTDGSPCSDATQVCDYGFDARPGCRNEYTCDGKTWKLTSAAAVACTVPPEACAANPASSDGLMCTLENALCDEKNGLYCSCLSQGPPVDSWHCDHQPMTPGCPVAPYPNLGHHCPTNGLSCAYGNCLATPQTGVVRVCKGNVWHDGGLGCP